MGRVGGGGGGASLVIPESKSRLGVEELLDAVDVGPVDVPVIPLGLRPTSTLREE